MDISSSSFPEETFIQVIGNNTFFILEFTTASSIYNCEVTFPEIKMLSLYLIKTNLSSDLCKFPKIRLIEIIQADASSANRELLFKIK